MIYFNFQTCFDNATNVSVYNAMLKYHMPPAIANIAFNSRSGHNNILTSSFRNSFFQFHMSPYPSAIKSTLTVHDQWKDQPMRERATFFMSMATSWG